MTKYMPASRIENEAEELMRLYGNKTMSVESINGKITLLISDDNDVKTWAQLKGLVIKT